MTYSIRTQDGIVVNNIPDDIPPDHESLKARVQNVRTMIQTDRANAAFAKEAADPTSGMSFLEKVRAGTGKGLADIGRGIAQTVGSGPTGAEVIEQRKQDAPLMNTVGGTLGNVGANVAALAPLAFVPGANTVAGAGAIGALTGMIQPATDTWDRFKNMALGGAVGSGAQYLGTTGARKMGEWSARRQAELAAEQARNQVKDETLRMGKEAGYVVPPSAVSDSFVGRRLESVAGKAALGQEAAIRNQEVTDRLAREAASLAPDQPISLTNLKASRQQLAEPYRRIAAIDPQAAQELEALQMARHESKLAWKEYNRQGVRTAYHDAVRADANAARLEQSLAARAQAAGDPALMSALTDARRALAQNRQVQEALNRGTGSVDASVIGRALDSGAPLSGPLETIGRFQQSFKPYMREGSTIPTPGVSKSEALASAVLGTTGAAAGGPAGILAGGLPLLSGPTRSLLLSKPVQGAVMTPTYQPGTLARLASGLDDPMVNAQLAAILRSGALTMIPEATQ